MADVHQRPRRGKGTDPSRAPSTRASPRARLAFSDLPTVRAWLADLRTLIDDLAAAAEDATRSPARRALGRATARRTILDATAALRQLLAAADRGAGG